MTIHRHNNIQAAVDIRGAHIGGELLQIGVGLHVVATVKTKDI
jgi:hypothetical protein